MGVVGPDMMYPVFPCYTTYNWWLKSFPQGNPATTKITGFWTPRASFSVSTGFLGLTIKKLDKVNF